MSNEAITLIEPILSLKDDFHFLAEEYLAEGDQRYQEAIRILKASSNYVRTRRSAAIWSPAEFQPEHILVGPQRAKDPRLFTTTPHSQCVS